MYIFRPLPISKKMAASFFTLIRDIICSTWEYRMNMTALIERVQDWVHSTSKNLNNPDWYYSLALKTWHQALQSAIGFLAGHFPGKFNICYVIIVINFNKYLHNMFEIVFIRVATRRLCSFY